MPRSIHALALAALLGAACAQTSQNPATVTAPTASATSTPAPSASADAPAASASPDAGATAPGPAGETEVDAQYRACQADADCIAVPRSGCCHNGWMEAIAATQKDAYEKAYACKQAHVICPMFIVRDVRVPRCDAQTHLCKMVQP
jgi:hypothetical protein